ncbi:MAG: TOBE domain-containing protein [Methanobacteriales archaeon]|nr:TOBE domain-containing protein [Methanobacteriales archaeon]
MSKENYKLKIKGKNIWLDNKRFRLLQSINEYNSIRKASEKSGIPYRTALLYIKRMENTLGEKIVSTRRGGAGGGGSSQLTKTGKNIIQEYLKMRALLRKQSTFNELKGIIKDINLDDKIIEIKVGRNIIKAPLKEKFEKGETVILLIHPEDILLMDKKYKISARNLLKTEIKSIKTGNNILKVKLKMDNIELTSYITREARDAMKLEIGKEIFAGFKATAIEVIKP